MSYHSQAHAELLAAQDDYTDFEMENAMNSADPTKSTDKHWMNNPWDAQRQCFVDPDPGYSTARRVERVEPFILIIRPVVAQVAEMADA